MEEYELCLSHDDDLYVEISRAAFHRIRVFLESKFDVRKSFEDGYVYFYTVMPVDRSIIVFMRHTIIDLV